MKYLLSIFFISFFVTHLSAQERHFVFIESDTKQPFYVSLNSKLYSSTASGYVIIPKLTEGNYNFTIGFAQNAFPEQTFSFALQNKDLGFELKNFNDKGWGLFNLQTLDVTMAQTGSSSVVAKALSENSNTKTDDAVISFDKKKEVVPEGKITDTAAAVLRSQVVKEPAVRADSVNVAIAAAGNAPPVVNEPVKRETSTTKASVNSDVRKVAEVKGDEGVHLSYVEGKAKDTIRIIIPTSPAPPATTQSSISTTDTIKNNFGVAGQVSQNSAPANAKDDVKFLDINMAAGKDSVRSTQTAAEGSRILENSNCKNIATDEDYAKLRRKMAMETSDEKMINEAKKFYRNKCFTTSQIKGLSSLFASDEGRFKFFDASFVSVADAGRYYTLQSELIDPAFVARFKGLLQ